MSWMALKAYSNSYRCFRQSTKQSTLSTEVKRDQEVVLDMFTAVVRL